MPARRAAMASIMRFRTRVIAPDSAPCTRPATSGCGKAWARLAKTAQPPIARKATATWTMELRAQVAHQVHQKRTRWKKIGAEKTTESSRSMKPPWPAISVAPVLDAAVALDGRHDEAAEEAHQRDDEREQSGLQRRERRHPPQAGADQRGAERRRRQTPPRSSTATGAARSCVCRAACPRHIAARREICTTTTRKAMSSTLRPS